MKDKILRIATKVNQLVSLFCAREVFYLVITMGVFFAFGMIYSGLNNGLWSDAWAFSYLFDAGQASKNICTRVLFFATWLVGGGVLVSVMVTQYYKIVGGYFRRWRCLVRNHIVVLGWDDGMMMELKRTVRENPATCYVITNQDVFALAKAFKNASLDDVVIYKGDYDNETEWKEYLQVGRAIKVFIAGELKEEAHDARVRLLYDKLSKVVAKGKIKVNIHDFGLDKQLMDTDKEVFENFHKKWAEFLWQQLALPQGSQLELFVVGFGAMGKAVVLAMPASLSEKASVVVTDDDEDKLSAEKARYDTQFVKSKSVEDKKWADALDLITKQIQSEVTRVIVVAKKRSEKGLLCMMDIIARFRDRKLPKNLKLALSQEIEGFDTNPEGAKMIIGPSEVVLFGMKKGC